MPRPKKTVSTDDSFRADILFEVSLLVRVYSDKDIRAIVRNFKEVVKNFTEVKDKKVGMFKVSPKVTYYEVVKEETK